jgi:hypothetical protein
MAAATVTKSDKAFITAVGPFKVEYILCTPASSGDTVTSKLASPSFAIAHSADATANSAFHAAVSGKTVTITFTGSAGPTLVMVFGDSVWS